MATSILLNKCYTSDPLPLFITYWSFMKFGKARCTLDEISKYEEEIPQYFLKLIKKEQVFTDRCWDISVNETEYNSNMYELLSCYCILLESTDGVLMDLCRQLYFIKRRDEIVLHSIQRKENLSLDDDVRENMQQFLFEKILKILYHDTNHKLENYCQNFVWNNGKLPTELPIEVNDKSYIYSSDAPKPIDISIKGLLAIIEEEKQHNVDIYEIGKKVVKQLYHNLIQNNFLSPCMESGKLNTATCCFMHDTLVYLGYPGKDTSMFRTNRDKRKAILDYVNSRL